jgi:hypothetical protein
MKVKKKSRARPGFSRITEEMKEWCAMLGQELGRWPQVTSRPMFGMQGFYRKAKIFAALPATRSIGTPNTIIFKLLSPPMLRRAMADARVDFEREKPARWRSFEIRSAEDLRDAMWWLNQAYERAK